MFVEGLAWNFDWHRAEVERRSTVDQLPFLEARLKESEMNGSLLGVFLPDFIVVAVRVNQVHSVGLVLIEAAIALLDEP